MATEYYFFVSGLPAQNQEDTKLVMSPVMFLHNAEEMLTAKDFALLKLILMPDNIDNLINYIHNEKEWSPESTITQEQWSDYIDQVQAVMGEPDMKSKLKGMKLPEFFIDFIARAYQAEELPSKPEMYHQLYSAFYAMAADSHNQFIKDWFQFDADMRNIIVALNCRKHEIPIAGQLIGENEITEKLMTSHANDFGLGKDFPLFEQLSRINDLPDIIDKEKGYDTLRWKWIDNQNFFEYFTIDRILGYFCKLRIQYRWVHLSQSLGENRFNIVLQGLENSFAFPEEFALNKR